MPAHAGPGWLPLAMLALSIPLIFLARAYVREANRPNEGEE